MNQYVSCFSEVVAKLMHSTVCHLTITFGLVTYSLLRTVTAGQTFDMDRYDMDCYERSSPLIIFGSCSEFLALIPDGGHRANRSFGHPQKCLKNHNRGFSGFILSHWSLNRPPHEMPDRVVLL